MVFFIVNPYSHYGGGAKIWIRLERALKRGKVEYESYLTARPGDARRFARTITEGSREPKSIVIVGGGGTLNEVLDGLAFGGKITLGYIAAGRNNDLARSLKLPMTPKEGLKRVLASRSYRLLDYGVLTLGSRAEHRRFAVSAGIGMDASVCRELLDVPVKRPVRMLGLEQPVCSLVGLKKLIRAKPVKGYIILDRTRKVEFNHIYFISAHILPFEGGFQLAPQANGDDGCLSVCVVDHVSKWRLFTIMLSALFLRKRGRTGIRTYKCREAFMHVDRPMASHADGEDCGVWSDLQAQCIEKKLRVIV